MSDEMVQWFLVCSVLGSKWGMRGPLDETGKCGIVARKEVIEGRRVKKWLGEILHEGLGLIDPIRWKEWEDAGAMKRI